MAHEPDPKTDQEEWTGNLGRCAGELARLNQALDPFGIGASFARVTQGWLGQPDDLSAALSRLALGLHNVQLSVWQSAVGLPPTAPVEAARDDARFADPAWSQVPALALLKQYYLAYTRWLEDTLYDSPGVTAKDRRRAAFWARQWLNAIAPTNYFLTNPAAVRKFWETGGGSLANGIRRWLDDLRVGDVQMTDRSAFQVGKNLATTPGAVIYRNELMELIRYRPQTDRVHAMPIVIVPPWINKYYILDLTENKSLVRHLVREGFSVFMVSWRNPGADLAGTTFDDYLTRGLNEAIEVARRSCGAPRVHAVGYCIGGTALAALMAWLNRRHKDEGDVPVAHWTLLASLVDFARPGAIEVFIDEDTIETLENMMAQQGYLDGREMGRTFRMLRSNSLIWHYFVHGYLYGETPPPFDVLFWNTDVTRMPRAMHSFYLREFYLRNRLVGHDKLTLADEPIDLARIRQPLYAVGCEEDHIAPWKATFKIAGAITAPVRYTLSTSGHILGIINPPVTPPKRSHWSGAADDGSPEHWHKRQRQRRIEGSWWNDWTTWLAERCGPKIDPPPVATPESPTLADAPGTYVHEA
ncbi:MAG: alpha/beta fold hydrolase [Betaproteobacteria bacterium]|nr:alpha/beta fold hydrolase [Betaproteobacteria bacterium]